MELDPLDEPGQRRLIELLARSGDRAGAIRQYRALVALFDRELGVAAAPRDDRAVRRDPRGASERDAPRLPTALAHVGATVDGVPVGSSRVAVSDRRPKSEAPGPLVGRDRELRAVLAAWRAIGPDGRLVVVEGEAGIGKTRLAEAVAASVRDGGGIVLATPRVPGRGAPSPMGRSPSCFAPASRDPGGVERLAGARRDVPGSRSAGWSTCRLRLRVASSTAPGCPRARASGSSRPSRSASPRSPPARAPG